MGKALNNKGKMSHCKRRLDRGIMKDRKKHWKKG